jgi:hypothetical protein
LLSITLIGPKFTEEKTEIEDPYCELIFQLIEILLRTMQALVSNKKLMAVDTVVSGEKGVHLESPGVAC